MDLAHVQLERRVDQLLAPYAGSGPGATIGVVSHGKLAVHRHAGLASIEHGVPISASTRFRIASVSKQFTCAAVLKLAGEGRLSTDDDIRQHLPELPDLGPISVDMMLRNMSGIRDMLEIMRHGGIDLSMPCTTADLMAGICRQRGTNFPPGERFLYSNSNFLLAGLIVERISGMALADYLQQHFFTPLGMTETRMTPATTDIVPALATGYLPASHGGFRRAPHAFPLGGEGGLVSSVVDLALWDQALNNGAADLGGLTEQGRFTNGVLCEYARGLVVSQYRGVRTEDHGGLWPGYRTAFLRAPGENVTVICIANSGAIDPAQLAYATLDAVIDGRPGVHAVPMMPTKPALEALCALYLDVKTPMTLELALTEAGALTATAHGVPMPVKLLADGRLQAGKGAFALMLQVVPDGLQVELPSGHAQHFRRVVEAALLPADLDGVYACADMEARWTISGSNVTLAGPIIRETQCTLSGVGPDIVRLHFPNVLFESWLDVAVQRDALGIVSSLLVHGGRAKRLQYTKLSAPSVNGRWGFSHKLFTS